VDMRLLIITDDQKTYASLHNYLEPRHFITRSTACQIEGQRLVTGFQPNLVILDVELSNMSGIEMCRQIRIISNVPILMISSIPYDPRALARGLDFGADAYITKPVDCSLLVAYVDALLRRCTHGDTTRWGRVYQDQYLLFEVSERSIFVKGLPVSLSPLEYQLLEMLFWHANHTVPALEILEYLWPGSASESTTNLRTYIKRLRKALEPDPAKPRYIVNEHGPSYRFVTQD
jgi:DNA-binding response OmpR family regulator